MTETLTSLHPKLVLYTSLDDAAEAVKKVEDEFLAILKEKIPGFLEPGRWREEGVARTASESSKLLFVTPAKYVCYIL